MSIMEMMCNRECRAFDLGIGEARYKSSWCDRSEPLFDTLLGVTVKGKLFALQESLRLRAKRFIKQNPQAWNTVQKFREFLG